MYLYIYKLIVNWCRSTKNISSINVNGVAATQVRTSGITPSSFEMNTYTIKGVCDSSLNWLLTIHVA